MRVPEGDDLVAALGSATAGWVNGVGMIEAVELRVAGEATDPIRALRGRFTLVVLNGPAGGPWGVVLARASDSGLDLVGGELVRARSLGVTLSIAPAADAVVKMPAPKPPPAAPVVRQAPAAAAAPAPVVRDARGQAPPSVWAADAAAAARRLREADRHEDQPFPEPGDLVRHFAFGLCEVLVADHDRLKIRDLDGPGRIREIRTDMLVVREPIDHDGKPLFQIERKS